MFERKNIRKICKNFGEESVSFGHLENVCLFLLKTFYFYSPTTGIVHSRIQNATSWIEAKTPMVSIWGQFAELIGQLP